MKNQNSYGEYQNRDVIPDSHKIGLAIAALCISLVNFIFFGSVLSFIAVPVSIIMAIISLKKKMGGKPFSIIAIVVSSLSTILFIFYMAIIVKIYPDMKYLTDNFNSISSEYEKTGTIPEYYDKYRDPKYDDYWKQLGVDSFDEFFEYVMKQFDVTYKNGTVNSTENEDVSSASQESSTVTTTDAAASDYDHNGEELVVLG